MKYAGRLAAVALAGALSLAACGTDNNNPQAGATSSAAAAGNDAGLSGTINAAGSSAQANAITEWTKNFTATNPGVTLNYQPSGSGAGVQSFIQGTVAFAGSDSALKEDEAPQADARCKTGKAINIPMVTGPVAVVYNLPGVDGIQLSPKTLAGIFNSKITKWDDAAIKAENPDAQLPSTPIQAFHRSDESGTSDNFTKFLKATAEADWPHEPGKAWPAEAKGQGSKGSDGIASSVKDTEGAISYVELSYAENSALQTAKVANGAGEFVELTAESAAKTVETAEITGTGNDLALSIDYATKTPGAYPIVLVTYEITCEKGLPAEEAKVVKSFLQYTASDEGQAALTELGYAPLSGELLTKVRTAVEAIS
ncbi:phosphate ABC transporter substrate-binding protein PstS [Nonomuraea aridisoli]|uniref:Phosphate-binding protein n=1 Tax=Nonomuraea aridisoli TaxID=2070368 RepID=A0A2W2DKW3_9ACTN|nr:phosphate ABC transporter substrate-binding protein PstS [Nonomuraea aridisoli]PZG11333.1 phosphate ABC transporter substrate-binding protein PstS [Nonomuraea aridisoli]